MYKTSSLYAFNGDYLQICFIFIFSCEVIRDHKTEESLQYAFIEFDNVSLYLVFDHSYKLQSMTVYIMY